MADQAKRTSKPTIDDVAALAGVARVTVSRVLNDQPHVRPEVRDKVLRAVEMLGYRVNLQARNLAGRSSVVISMIHATNFESEPNSYFNSALELGATRASARLGAHLHTHVVNQNGPSAASEIIAHVNSDQSDGVILTPPFSDDSELVGVLSALGHKVLCVAAGTKASDFPYILGIDDRHAGFEIGVHLLAQGCRNFGFIRGLKGHESAEYRFDGFLDAVREAGLSKSDILLKRGDFTFRSGHDCAESLLASSDRIDALVCANDDMAAGALLAVHKAGMEIPQDIVVTGFDDTPVSEIVWPPLTTIHQPLKWMGERAVECLAQVLSGDAPTSKLEIAPHRLIIRDSSRRI